MDAMMFFERDMFAFCLTFTLVLCGLFGTGMLIIDHVFFGCRFFGGCDE